MAYFESGKGGLFWVAADNARMAKKLTRHGNSMALVLDKPVLELLHIDANTPLEIVTDGTALVITPVRNAKREAKFRKALAAVNQRYGRMLRNWRTRP